MAKDEGEAPTGWAVLVQELRSLIAEMREMVGLLKALPLGQAKKAPGLMTGDEVLALLRMGKPTPAAREKLRTLRRLRRVPYVKFGRRILYPEGKLLALIEKNTEKPIA